MDNLGADFALHLSEGQRGARSNPGAFLPVFIGAQSRIRESPINRRHVYSKQTASKRTLWNLLCRPMSRECRRGRDGRRVRDVGFPAGYVRLLSSDGEGKDACSVLRPHLDMRTNHDIVTLTLRTFGFY